MSGAIPFDTLLLRAALLFLHAGSGWAAAAEAGARAELHGKEPRIKSEPEPSLQAISNLGLGNGETSRTYAKECQRKTQNHVEIQLP